VDVQRWVAFIFLSLKKSCIQNKKMMVAVILFAFCSVCLFVASSVIGHNMHLTGIVQVGQPTEKYNFFLIYLCFLVVNVLFEGLWFLFFVCFCLFFQIKLVWALKPT